VTARRQPSAFGAAISLFAPGLLRRGAGGRRKAAATRNMAADWIKACMLNLFLAAGANKLDAAVTSRAVARMRYTLQHLAIYTTHARQAGLGGAAELAATN